MAKNAILVERLPFPCRYPGEEGDLKQGEMAYCISRGDNSQSDDGCVWVPISPELDAAFNVFQKVQEDAEDGLRDETDAMDTENGLRNDETDPRNDND